MNRIETIIIQYNQDNNISSTIYNLLGDGVWYKDDGLAKLHLTCRIFLQSLPLVFAKGTLI